MTTCFYQVSSVWQIILLVISQMTVITLAGGCVLLFWRKCSVSKTVAAGGILLLNAMCYVMMQLDSRITKSGQGLHLHVPYAVLLLVTLLSLGFVYWAVLSETKNRKIISRASIKEAFDNLPAGVCFFNEVGLPVLCNLAMHRFGFAVCGRDVQLAADLEACFSEDFVPAEDVRRDGKVFVHRDGRAWRLKKRQFLHESGVPYTQYVAIDVTELYRNRLELMQENEQLRKVRAQLKKLSANVVAATREEEILNTKMRVHDEMGRCLLAAQKYLKQDNVGQLPDEIAVSWRKAISMLKYNNETLDEDMMLQIRKTCEFVKLDFIKTGELPRCEDMAYLLTCAVRECVTNAVRYAEATALYVDFAENEETASVTVTNNGKVPEGEIKEGGGLSTLRHRVERAGGIMVLQSQPTFRLIVTIPKRMEGAL